FWVEGYWVEPGDRVTFRMRGPNGATVVDHAMKLEEAKQRWFGYAGARRPGTRRPAGAYAGEITLERTTPDGPRRVTLERSIELREPSPPPRPVAARTCPPLAVPARTG